MSRAERVLAFFGAALIASVFGLMVHGIYIEITQPLHVYNAYKVFCTEANVDINDKGDDFKITSCNKYSLSQVGSLYMSRDKDFIKNHCFEYAENKKCLRAVENIHVNELKKHFKI